MCQRLDCLIKLGCFFLTYPSGAFLQDFKGFRLAEILCHPSNVTPLDTLSGGFHDNRGDDTQCIGDVIHCHPSCSVNENLAAGHTYWQEKLRNVVSSLVATVQLKWAIKEGRTNFEGQPRHHMFYVFFVLNKIQWCVGGGQSEAHFLTLPNPTLSKINKSQRDVLALVLKWRINLIQ